MRFNFLENRFEQEGAGDDKLAVRGEDRDITWNDLLSLVQKIESILIEIEVPQGHPILLYGHKEALYPIWILALMKNNIPYVPLDVIYPSERVRGIAEETESQIVVNLSGKPCPIDLPIEIDHQLRIIRSDSDTLYFKVYGEFRDPIRYILYTSGSTGKPKGVVITKRAVTSFIRWIEEEYDFSNKDVFLNQSPFTFDVSLYDTLSGFHLGASIFLVDRNLTKDANAFIQKINDYGCTVWTSTPSFAYIFLRNKIFNGGSLPAIRKFLFAGEQIPIKTVEILDKNFPAATIWNAYGPTEATITTTLIQLTPELIQTLGEIPIGYPKNTSRLLIDNEQDDPAQLGEIIICGDHVASGYFKRPELTKQKFEMRNGIPAFKTGDLGYFKGNILFFKGRNDDQVKMHGYRIELGEIAAKLEGLEGVDEAVAIPLYKGDEIRRIVAFVKCNSEEAQERVTSMGKTLLKGNLPEYMIPGDIRSIQEWPTNANHKIDRKTLTRIYLNKE